MQPTPEPTPEAPSIGSGSAFSHASSIFAGPSVRNMFDPHPESTPTTPEDSLHSHAHALSMSIAAIDGLPRTASEATLAGPQARTNVTSGAMFGAVAQEDTYEEEEARRLAQEEQDQALAPLTSPNLHDRHQRHRYRSIKLVRLFVRSGAAFSVRSPRTPTTHHRPARQPHLHLTSTLPRCSPPAPPSSSAHTRTRAPERSHSTRHGHRPDGPQRPQRCLRRCQHGMVDASLQR